MYSDGRKMRNEGKEAEEKQSKLREEFLVRGQNILQLTVYVKIKNKAQPQLRLNFIYGFRKMKY